MKGMPRGADGDQRQQLERTSWLDVVRAYLECSRRYTLMLAHFDLTVAQYDVLSAIDSHRGGAQPKAIAERLLVSRANITGVIRRLQDSGLVQTQEHREDGRSILCRLTPAGERRLRGAQAAGARFMQAQLQPFSDADLAQVAGIMQRMHAHLLTLDPDRLALEPGS